MPGSGSFVVVVVVKESMDLQGSINTANCIILF